MNTNNTTTITAPAKFISKLSVQEKINLLMQVWGAMAPQDKFAGMSLSDFRSATAASHDTRENLQLMHATRKGGIAKRIAADKDTAALLVSVAAGVKADPFFGVNSALYRAMGFVPANERKSPSATTHSGTAGAAPTEAAAAPTRSKGRQDLMTRVERFIRAWTKFAPESSFAGQSLAGFTAAVAPSVTLRDERTKDRVSIAGTIAARNIADRTTSKLIQRVIASIKAEADFGPDSSLYRSLGYVTASERRSGKRTKTASAVTPPAANTSAPAVPA